jgi:hypothetical protein
MFLALLAVAVTTLLAMIAFDVLRFGGPLGVAIDRSRLKEVGEGLRERLRRD